MNQKDPSRMDAVCGLYCGACTIRIAVRSGRLAQLAEKTGRSESELYCEGCRSGTVAAFCSDCYFKHCTASRGIESCSECPEMPCVHLLAFKDDEWAHHSVIVENLTAIRDAGRDAWLADQRARWTCPDCRTEFSWYDTLCRTCGKALSSCADDDKRLR